MICEDILREPVKLGQFCVKRTSRKVSLAIPFWVELLDPGMIVGIEYMDFMKAFDKFCHYIPEDNMNKYRLVTKIIGWFNNKLKNYT